MTEYFAQKNINKELLNQILLYQGLIDSIPDIIFFKNINGIYLGCNLALTNYLGLSKDKIKGKTDFELFSKERAEFHRYNDLKCIELNQPFNNEEWIEYKDGRKVLIDTLKAPLYDSSNHLIGVLGLCRDITEHKRLEKSLLDSKSQQRAILDNIPFMTWLKDKHSNYVAVNKQFALAFNTPIKDVVGKTDFDFHPPELSDTYRIDDFEVLNTGKSKLIEEQFVISGDIRWSETFKAPIFDKDGNVVGTTGLARDITERKLAEQTLLLRDKLLSAVAKAINELVVNLNYNEAITKALSILGNATNVHKVYIYKNNYDTDLNKYFTSKKYEWTSKEEYSQINNPKLQNVLIDDTFYFLMPLLENKPVSMFTKDMKNTTREIFEELDIKSLLVFPIFIEGNFWGFVGFDDCVSEKIWSESEKAILSSFAASLASLIDRNEKRQQEKNNEKRIRTVLNSISDGIIIIDENYIIESSNLSISEMFGYSLTEITGSNLDMLIPDLLNQFYNLGMDNINCFNTQLLNKEFSEGKRKDGTTFPIEIELRKIDFDGKLVILMAIRDITQRKEVDRLKNEFISTVSHELRTPLTSIRGSLGVVLSGCTGEISADTKEFIDIAHNNSARLISLINDILDIEKIEAGKMEFDIELQEIMPIVKQSIEANIPYAEQFNVKLELEQSLLSAKVKVDKNRLIQVLTNLLSNAAKFSDYGNTVKISVFRYNEKIRITVTNRGLGIPKEFHGSIFKKFAQADSSDTKFKGGTGLGLNISKSIIEKLNGTIGFSSGTGKETIFYFDLDEFNDDLSQIVSENLSGKPHLLICENNKDVDSLINNLSEPKEYLLNIINSIKTRKD